VTDSSQRPVGHEGVHPPALPPQATGPDAGTGDPTDGRQAYDWESHYPPKANSLIRQEAAYVAALLFLSLFFIYLTWRGLPIELVGADGARSITFRRYCYYAFAGLLGGSVFGIKYLYRVVARGYWHFDRRLWRFLSPHMSMAVAFAIGALFDANYFSSRAPASAAAVIGLGFLIGYFADQAVAKLHEIANVLFGTVAKNTEPPKNKK
jgi:hypothetical protein